MNSGYKEFTGKVAVVTGASSGIGASVAVALSRLGARVVLVALEEPLLRAVAGRCPADTRVLVADLDRDESIARIIAEAVDSFGQIDLLINCAGIGTGARFRGRNALATYEHVMNVNLYGAVKLTHAALPYLVETKGNIVNVSSTIADIISREGCWAYGISKSALNFFTRSMADELADRGIRVNAVAPGPSRTSIFTNAGVDSGMQDAAFETAKIMTALKRLSEPEEIADVIVFLASDKARGVTGSCWVCDNGLQVASHI